MSTSKLTSKGQTTIPKRVRDFLGVGPGDELGFFTEEDNSGFKRAVVIPRTVKVEDLCGIAKLPPGSGPIDIDRAIQEAVYEDDLRIRRQSRPDAGADAEAEAVYKKVAEPTAGYKSK